MMNRQIISRKNAKEHGLIKYFTGKPCKNGHVDERYVSGFACITCLNERNAHPMKVAMRIAWFAKNKNNKKTYDAEYKKLHPRDRTNERQYAHTKAKRRAAKLLRTPSWLTKDDLFMMKEAYHLAKLRTKIFGFEWHVDHIIPLQGRLVSGLHVPTNLQVISKHENLQKHNLWEVA